MFALDSTQKSLEIVLDGAVTPDFHITVGYYDVPSQTKNDYSQYRRATVLSRSDDTTPVTICEAPEQSHISRVIEYICVFNPPGGTTAVATISIDENGTASGQKSKSLAAGESLVYEHGAGWS